MGQHSTTQPRVLIVDDDDMVQEMLKAALRSDCDCSCVSDGQAALERARLGQTDVIVLDVDMPGMDGYATCRALQADALTKDVPVIFLSAKATIEERMRGYEVGGVDYLTKPYDAQELKTKIALVVNQRAKRLELDVQLDEAINTVMTSVNMYGEVGVVMGFLRRLNAGDSYEAVAQALFEALQQFGVEGCVRLKGRRGGFSYSVQGPCSALESSILDHIETRLNNGVNSLGLHATFCYDHVVMLIRNLPREDQARHLGTETAERFGRMRDNLVLIAEGAASRIPAIDSQKEVLRLEGSKRLVELTREALLDLNAQQRTHRQMISAVLQKLVEDVERSFVHLGLSDHQENMLGEVLRQRISEAMAVFDQGDKIEQLIEQVIRKLQE